MNLSRKMTYPSLLKYTIPSIAMMIFTSIYTVVDGFFISNFIGEEQFAAVNIIIPFLMIMASVGFMYGTGGTALVSKTLGEGKIKEANKYFSLIVYFSLALSLLFSVVGLLFIEDLSLLLGARGELLPHSVQYGRILLITLPFFIMQLLFQSFFVAAGKHKIGLYVTLLSGFTNILLDALLVLTLPYEYKLLGAALATGISQCISGLISLFYFIRKNDSYLNLGKTHWVPKVIKDASINGSSELMTNISVSMVAIVFNYQLLRFIGHEGVAAYGVMMYVSMIFTAAYVGYAIGIGPAISYHYGAKNIEELKRLLRMSIRITLLFGIIMLIASQISTRFISETFVGDHPRTLELTIRGFRIFACSFGLMGIGIFSSAYFTALNDGITSAILSFTRTLVFGIITVMILPLLLGEDGIWYSVVLTEILSVILCVFFIKKKAIY